MFRTQAIRSLTSALAALFLAGGALSASAQTASPAKSAPARTVPPIVTQVCAGCHGLEGNSVAPANPKLAAQHPQYLRRQLAGFRVKEGGGAADRASPLMAGFAMMLTPESANEVSAYYAAQALVPAVAMDSQVAIAGQRIFRAGIASKGVPACSGCHGPSGAGIPAEYPRIAGQYAEYSAAQLVAFRQGTRQNSPQMSAIASRLSDLEIRAVSEYLAGLR